MSEIPHRLSVDDEGYDAELGRSLRVKLDGVEQRHVIGYDLVAGTVTRAVLDQQGQAQIEPGTDDWWIETVTGTVEVSRA